MRQRAVSPFWLVCVAAGWMAAAGNLALWRKMSSLGLLAGLQGGLFALAMLLIVWASLVVLLGVFAWRITLKPVVIVLLGVAAVASHFMLGYGVVIDPGMITNALQTDRHEAGDLFSGQLLLAVGGLALLPAWLVWRQPLEYGPLRRQLLQGLLLALLGVVVLGAVVLASFQTLAASMRNHKELRYLLNPLASLYSIGRVAARPWQRDSSTLVTVGLDAHLATPARPALLLLVLGETARSGNFSVNGYPRQTTPELEHEQVLSFRNAWSCGTSTAASLPCMFSDLTQEHFDGRTSEYEGLMDVLQRAGLAVLWLDNQSGCKGVCDRIPALKTAADARSRFCSGGECLDEVMLDGVDERIAALDPARVARGLVLVMHQMGSHGPAYHLRSPMARKRFLPECNSPALQDCDQASVVNAYDNSIAYTDHFLGEAIAWLKRQESRADTAMIYVSDHGESLGEGNLYLHGMPYAIAPDVQKRVPWVTWVSTGFRQATGLSVHCLRAAQDMKISHDSYFHSVLGMMGVRTSAYRPALDAYARCRGDTGEFAIGPPS